jgi:hypothetical protein
MAIDSIAIRAFQRLGGRSAMCSAHKWATTHGIQKLKSKISSVLELIRMNTGGIALSIVQ